MYPTEKAAAGILKLTEDHKAYKANTLSAPPEITRGRDIRNKHRMKPK